MNFWETITGSDLTREWKAFQARADALPADFKAAWDRSRPTCSPTGTSAAAT
jgi:DNA-binding ferritin-like protein (Dps family)